MGTIQVVRRAFRRVRRLIGSRINPTKPYKTYHQTSPLMVPSKIQKSKRIMNFSVPSTKRISRKVLTKFHKSKCLCKGVSNRSDWKRLAVRKAEAMSHCRRRGKTCFFRKIGARRRVLTLPGLLIILMIRVKIRKMVARGPMRARNLINMPKIEV